MNNNADFWTSIESIINDGFTSEGLQKLDCYAEQFISRNLYINDFHRSNSMAAQREVQRMSLQPYSREQKLMQIQSLRESRISKECSNAERKKLKG